MANANATRRIPSVIIRSSFFYPRQSSLFLPISATRQDNRVL
jgi:hypothetical protein